MINLISETNKFLSQKNRYEKMVKIPAGPFKYGNDNHEENIDQPFEIDIYPVTNSQYGMFIDAYRLENIEDTDYWSDEGEKYFKNKPTHLPDFWNDDKFNNANQPVVGVSYFEAEAYAKWAGKRLSSEKEWEKAARGPGGVIYPWGNTFDKDMCNSLESGIDKTTDVTNYNNGKSHYGCYDMAGNVWEWTSSDSQQFPGYKATRGGSFLNESSIPISEKMVPFNKTVVAPDIGFRCVRSFKKDKDKV